MNQRMADLGERERAAEAIRLRRERKTRQPAVRSVVRRLEQNGQKDQKDQKDDVASTNSGRTFACRASSRREVARLNRSRRPASF
jgi:hypothetical protein